MSPSIELWFEFARNHGHLSVMRIEPARVALDRLGLPAQDMLDEAQGEASKIRLRNQNEEAKNKGIFGAPTFFVGDETFWGNDRLEDAFDHCRSVEIHEATGE
jgi:2-hydroxychromene-2-carboxylate isomerase